MKRFTLAKSRFSYGQTLWPLLLLCVLATLPGCTTSTLQSIQIIPATGAQLNSQGATLQFKAIGTYTHGSHPATTQDITSLVSWASTNAIFATINASGMATAVSGGTTTITATGHGNLGVVIGSADLAVTMTAPPVVRDLTAIAIVPGSQTIATAGGTAQFVAIGTFSSPPLSEDLSATAVWKSTEMSIATINNVGLAAGVGVGNSTIAASARTAAGAIITATATVTVTAANTLPGLVSISIVPGSQAVSAIREAAQFIAIGTFSGAGPTTQDITSNSNVTWRSSDVSVAAIDAHGLATGNGAGTTAITLTAPGAGGGVIYGTATFTDSSGTPPVGDVSALSVYKVGNGTGLVTASYKDPQGKTTQILSCGSGPQCVGVVPTGSQVFLSAAPDGSFGGWSSNCASDPSDPTNPEKCSLTLSAISGNQTVVAIFN